MGLFKFPRREDRAETVTADDQLLQALMEGDECSREMALQIPAVSGAVDLIGGIIAGTPLKLYTEKDGKAEEVQGDVRVRLLNDETGDTLSANEFWRAMVRDYYLGKGGFAYIHRQGGRIVSIHHVDERQITVQKNADPIFKRHDIFVQGQRFHPHQFLTILRNTEDGMTGRSVIDENPRLIEAAYAMLIYERNLTRRGGNKKGFLRSEKTLAKEALDALRAGFRRMYSTDGEGSDNFVVLNSGVDFKESSATPLEMQLRENKAAFAEDFAGIFHLPKEALTGEGADTSGLARLCAIPLMNLIQCSLNRVLLLESEKSSHYFAFDTKELLKGDMQSRFAAYKTALEANFMGIDEVRYAEDLEPLGVSWIRLGLQDVLYDPKTKQLYTPNTDKTAMVGGKLLPAGGESDILEEDGEERGDYIQGPDGKMRGSRPGGGKKKTKYAPSPQRYHEGIQVGPNTYAKLCGIVKTEHPQLTSEDGIVSARSGNYRYRISVKENGSVIIHTRIKLK